MTSRKLCSSFWRFYPLIALCSVAIGTDAQMVSVTWNLNMTNETVATEGPSVAGGLDFGYPGDNPMSDPDGDGIWTLTLQVLFRIHWILHFHQRSLWRLVMQGEHRRSGLRESCQLQ